MEVKISHETIYNFNEAVFLEPHELRFKPATDHYLSIEDFAITVSPKPIGLSDQIDAEGNAISFCWFEGLHKELKIQAESVVETHPFNPFNHLIYPATFLAVPFKYSEESEQLLKASLHHDRLPEDLKKYIEEVITSVNSDTTSFLLKLTQQIHKDFKVETREEGVPLTPEETFNERRGSCRDLTWMEMQGLRSLGIATRFVSGYFYLDSDEPQYELHAWLEVYIPGAGWIGYDPSHGIAVGHTHIPVAKSSHYENTMPVVGTVRGDGTAALSYDLKMEVLKHD